MTTQRLWLILLFLCSIGIAKAQTACADLVGYQSITQMGSFFGPIDIHQYNCIDEILLDPSCSVGAPDYSFRIAEFDLSQWHWTKDYVTGWQGNIVPPAISIQDFFAGNEPTCGKIYAIGFVEGPTWNPADVLFFTLTCPEVPLAETYACKYNLQASPLSVDQAHDQILLSDQTRVVVGSSYFNAQTRLFLKEFDETGNLLQKTTYPILGTDVSNVQVIYDRIEDEYVLFYDTNISNNRDVYFLRIGKSTLSAIERHGPIVLDDGSSSISNEYAIKIEDDFRGHYFMVVNQDIIGSKKSYVVMIDKSNSYAYYPSDINIDNSTNVKSYDIIEVGHRVNDIGCIHQTAYLLCGSVDNNAFVTGLDCSGNINSSVNVFDVDGNTNTADPAKRMEYLDGEFYIAGEVGTFFSPSTLISGKTWFGSFSVDSLFSSNINWLNIYEKDAGLKESVLDLDYSGDYFYITGQTGIEDLFTSSNNTLGPKAYVSILDLDGNLIESKNYAESVNSRTILKDIELSCGAMYGVGYSADLVYVPDPANPFLGTVRADNNDFYYNKANLLGKVGNDSCYTSINFTQTPVLPAISNLTGMPNSICIPPNPDPGYDEPVICEQFCCSEFGTDPCESDTTPPTITCPNDIVLPYSSDLCCAFYEPIIEVVDNCDIYTLSCTLSGSTTGDDSNACYNVGVTVVTCIATDEAGNSASCSFTVTVDDLIPPDIMCPADIIQQAAPGSNGTPIALPPPTATDECSSVTFTCDYTSGYFFECGETIVTCVATDDSGNSAVCTHVVTVVCSPVISTMCGKAVMTCFSASNPSDVVLGIKDVRDQSTAPLLAPWSANPYNHPNWIKSNLGEIFGIAIDNNDNIYVTATTIYQSSNVPPSTFGPAGSGGIYKIDPISGAILPFVTTQSNISLNTIGTSTIPNDNNGLGNICFDSKNNQFFVTNFEDGKIYRIDLSGTVLSIFDPFSPDIIGNTDPACLGERIFGIGYFDNRVYFSQWNEDLGQSSPSSYNQIYSVALDPFTGDFAGSEILEIGLPNYLNLDYSMPISDIEFSQSGKMLVAERSLYSNSSCSYYNYAHESRVFEYEGGHLNWNPIPKQFYIGNYGGYTNAAGGIDYGYKSFNTQNPNPNLICDEMIWATGDALILGGGIAVYGLAGIPSEGNSPAVGSNYSPLNSYYIDADNNINDGGDKTRIGDVDIFKCGCYESTVNCDDLVVTAQESQLNDPDVCCYDFDITNNVGTTITKLEAELLTPGWIFGQGTINLSNNLVWGSNIPTNSELCMRGNNAHIPIGLTASALEICLDTLPNLPHPTSQTVVFRWYEQIEPGCEEVVCTDTITLMCDLTPRTDCAEIVEHSISCSANSPFEYELTFKVENQSSLNLDAYYLILQDLNNPAMSFQACGSGNSVVPNLLVPLDPFPLLPNSTSNNLCAKIVSSTPILAPVDVCFKMGLNFLTDCCHDTREYCVTLEPCCDPCEDLMITTEPVVNPTNDNCCYHIDIDNTCEYEIFTKIDVQLLTPNVIFGFHAINNSYVSAWNACGSTPTYFCYEPVGGVLPSGNLDNIIEFCLDDINMQSQIPQDIVINFYSIDGNGEEYIACTKQIQTDCIPKYECLEISDIEVACDSNNPNQKYNFSFTVTNYTTDFTPDNVQALIIAPPGLTLSPGGGLFPLPSPFNTGDSHTVNTCITGTLPPSSYNLVINYRLSTLSGDSCCYENVLDTIPLPYCDPSNPCPPDDFVLGDTYQNDNVFKTMGTITSDGNIPPAGDITFKSAIEINLEPGFEVDSGAEFCAAIELCCCSDDPLNELTWLQPWINDPLYEIAQASIEEQCVFIVSTCVIAGGVETYYDCEGNYICENADFLQNCPVGFNPQNWTVLQACQ